MSENILTFLTLVVFMECSCFLLTDATTVPRFKDSPGEDVFTIVGKTIELKWTFEVNLTEYPGATLQLSQPSDRLLYAVQIRTNQTFPQNILNGIPFSNRITWTGNVADKIASFTFSNVTRDLSLKYFLTLYFPGPQTTESVILHVLERPTFVVNKTHQEKVIREGKNLTENCTTVWELPMTVKWIKDGFSLFNGTNSSTLNIDAINRSQSGIYSCEGTNNLATIRRWINVSVVYLDYTCTAQFEDGRIILKTSATGRPRVKCHPRLCPSRIDLTAEKNTSWVQVIENGLIRHFCNVTKAVYDARMKCPDDRSLELNFTWFSYSVRGDKSTMTFFRDVGGNTTVKGLLYVDGVLKNPNNTNFDLKLVGDTRARNFLENACGLKGNGRQITKLSGGAIAGIVIGVAALVIVIIFGLYCFWPKKA